MSWHVVCPACGDGVVIAGGADTAAGEIVMRRNEGEVVVRIRYTGGPFTDEPLHTCAADEYRPNTPVPWKQHPDFPVRLHVSRLAGDSPERVAHRVEMYAQGIGTAVDYALRIAPEVRPGTYQAEVVSPETFRAVEPLLQQAFDLIDPPREDV